MEPTMNTLLNFAMPRLWSQCLKRGSRRFIEIVRENACIKGPLPGIQLVFVRRDRGFWMFGLIRMPRVTVRQLTTVRRTLDKDVWRVKERVGQTSAKDGSLATSTCLTTMRIPLLFQAWHSNVGRSGFWRILQLSSPSLRIPFVLLRCFSLSLSFSVYKLYMHPCRLMYHTSRHLCEWVSTQGDIIHAKCTVQVYRCIYDYIYICIINKMGLLRHTKAIWDIMIDQHISRYGVTMCHVTEKRQCCIRW